MKTTFDFFIPIEKYIEEPQPNEPEVLKRYVEGYCVVSGNVDEQFDVVSPEALAGAVKWLKKYSTVLYNHDQDRPIGTVKEARIVGGKIWVKVLISGTEDDVWQKVTEGVLNSFSVSGLIEDYSYEKREGTDIRVIKQMRIYEISLVSVPANSEAKTLRAYLSKALDGIPGNPPTAPIDGVQGVFDKPKLDNLFREVNKAMSVKDKIKQVVGWLNELASAAEDDKVKSILEQSVSALSEVLGQLEKYPYPYPQPQSGKSIELEQIASELEELKKSFEGLTEITEKIDQLSVRIENLEKFKTEQEEVSKTLLDFLTEYKKTFLGDGEDGDKE